MTDGEPIYEPFKPRKRRRRNLDTAEDSQGQRIEYERGYLREQAKAKRGYGSSLRRKPKARYFTPPVVEDCGIEILYVLELQHIPSAVAGALRVELWWRPTTGRPALKPMLLTKETTAPSPEDQRLLQILHPFQERCEGTAGNVFMVPFEAQKAFISALAEVRQVRWSARQDCSQQWQLHRLAVSSAEKTPWFAEFSEAGGYLYPRIYLASPERDYALPQWQALGAAGWAIAGDTLYLLPIKNAFALLAPWMTQSEVRLTEREAANAIQILTVDGGADLSNLAEERQCNIEEIEPVGQLYISTARFKHLGMEQLQCELSFNYAGKILDDGDTAPRIAAAHRVFLRNLPAEERLREELRALDFRLVTRRGGDEDPGWKLLPAKLDGAVRKLVLGGWQITAEGKSYRRPTAKSFTVSASGIDWLELNAEISFDAEKAGIPEILAALKSGAKTVMLDDGTYGILPQEWLEKFTALVEIGESSNQRVRFRQQQAALVNALLAEQLQDLDGKYEQAIIKANRSAKAQPLPAPPQFRASLRPYQQEALGWLRNLEEMGLGGILADDMGLGKTIEVLSLLTLRHNDSPGLPSLIVMPSSLLFNWEAEARKFAPQLRTGMYYGGRREASAAWFSNYDLVFTTYGTLRIDAVQLAQIPFDYVILDEAQAIKNADSATAQSARILKAQHRIAMTGTPIENHLCELFSQLGFLNPGLFTAKFTARLGKESALLQDPETCKRLRNFIAPFILRRRKEQVATELPPKTEQVLWCGMDASQKRYYDELREYYRQEMQDGGEQNSPAVSSMLTALLRLRQAACHIGLVNPGCQEIPSAKLTLLSEQLAALLEAGHKALVFSQFTSLLQIVRRECDNAGWKYCYLDGQTVNRATLVHDFQNDPEIGIFLISLKAGGVGLNLTAADYVFILDPWWNPAAEAQAIDRAYRIGQTKPVFAYRLITKDTVEEKVLQMQRQKLGIVNAALDASGQIPDSVTAADLRALLSGN